MSKLLENIKRIRIQNTQISFGGISLELGLEKKVSPANLRELFIIRNILSHYYFLYQNKSEDLMYKEDDEDVINNLLCNDLYPATINTYKKLAEVMLNSEYFMLLDIEKRDRIIESFDYVNKVDTFLDVSEDNEISDEEIAPMIEQLIILFTETDELIKDLQRQN